MEVNEGAHVALAKLKVVVGLHDALVQGGEGVGLRELQGHAVRDGGLDLRWWVGWPGLRGLQGSSESSACCDLQSGGVARWHVSATRRAWGWTHCACTMCSRYHPQAPRCDGPTVHACMRVQTGMVLQELPGTREASPMTCLHAWCCCAVRFAPPPPLAAAPDLRARAWGPSSPLHGPRAGAPPLHGPWPRAARWRRAACWRSRRCGSCCRNPSTGAAASPCRRAPWPGSPAQAHRVRAVQAGRSACTQRMRPRTRNGHQFTMNSVHTTVDDPVPRLLQMSPRIGWHLVGCIFAQEYGR